MSRLQKHYRKLHSILIGVILSVILLFCWYGYGKYQERKTLEADLERRRQERLLIIENTKEAEASAKLPNGLNGDLAEYQGESYRRNTYIKAILCVGVDRKDVLTETRKLGETGQADGIFLIAQDTVRNTVQILLIPRDTMTEVERINSDGTKKDTKVTHLNVAYAYGDGHESSCENMVRAVSRLLGGLSIEHYMALDMSALKYINDAVGGITVTVPTPGMEQADPAFVYGSQVTLHGDQAESFLRYRDIEKRQSPMFRMGQHQEYITQYFQALKQASAKNSQLVPQLFDEIQSYMVTDMGKEQYLKIALDTMANNSIDGDNFRILPGVGTSEHEYDEFYVDQEQLIPLILDLFYRKVT